LIKTIKTIAALLGIFWILIFTIWLALSTVLLLKRDEIGQYLVIYLNQIQSGELKVGQVSISTLRQFPNISLNLENVIYYEHRANQRTETEQPIAKFENFYCGLEILKLFKGDLEISKVNLNNGEILIIIYPDSSINLLNAIKSDSTIAVKKIPKLSKTGSKPNEPSISIENLSITDIHLKVTNDPDKRESSILINKFESDFDFKGTQANLNFTTSILIEKFKINEDNYITNQEIDLDVLSHLEKNKGLEIEEGKLEFANSTFHFSGHFNPSNNGDLSLKITSDGSLNILSLFVKENVANNLRKGDFYLFGYVEGKTFSQFPLINFDFGFKDVELINPITKRTIKNLNLKGYFNSGRNKDLSGAEIRIDTLFANFPKGQIKLAGSVNNFAQPEFDINLFLDADVTGLDDVFKLASVDSLKGRIVLKDRTKGKYDISNKRFNNDINVSEITFQNFGFIIPGTIRFGMINGEISRNGDSYSLKDINIKSESTDFNINGEIDNLQYIIFNIEKEIKANLAIKSTVFDLPNFLEFDPSIKRDFPHRILNLDLVVNATTTTSKLLHFKSFPEISFDIKKLNATAEDFLPALDIKSGIFKISEDVLGFHMGFYNFKTDFLDGVFNFSGDYNSSRYEPYYIKSNIDMDDIDISKLLFSETADSIPDFYKSKLDGSLSLELQFADDTTEINLFNIKNGDINYFYGENSVTIKSLFFTSEKIDYSIERNPNPLATIFAKGNIKADEIKTSEFLVNESDFDFLIQNGEYIVETRKPKFFGDNSKGEIKYSLKPYIENPSYHIYCNISSFDIKEMMYTFLKDTTISGNLSLNMDISMKGKEWKEMLATMDGGINLGGKNLIFYGVDADKLIEEFQRSQNFNLVDVGGMLLAGPVGLAITKGSDFAKILITNPGQSSQITQIVSNWNVKDGILTLKDVALSTKKNRVAAKGWLNVFKDSLGISFAVIDAKGCSIFTQDVYGDLNKPTLGKVKVVSTLLAPVTNLYDNIMSVNCQVFYTGSLPPPK
jgi:AsmA protein